MAEFKFNCPSCSQKIQATDAWAGHTIQCPACHQNIQVPAPAETPPAAAPPESKPGLKIGLAAHTKSAPAPIETFSQGANPTRHFSASQGASTGKAEKIKRIAMIAACVLLVPPAGYFGFIKLRDYQAKANIKRQQEAADSDGGRLGHIASLYDALDKTDPAKYSRFGDSSDDKKGKGRATAGTNTASGAAEEKPVAPTYTLDIDRAKLQRGKVNGNLGGTNFVAGGVFVDVTGGVNLLSIREGTNAFSDRELLVYLKLKPGETLGGQSWTISPDTRTNVPNVVKRWRPNPKFAPQQKSFANGYVMRLEFVNQSPELVQGRIYLALPDTEQTVVAGQFTATVRQVKPVAAATPVARPPQQQAQPQRQAQRRY